MNIEYFESLVVIFGNIATGIGVIVALIFGISQARAASKSLKKSQHSTQLQALVAFDQLLEKYHHIHSLLRPGGDLVGKKEGLSHQNIVDLERYMGLFERAKIFIDDKYLSIDHFRNLYGYRMCNIAQQPWIRHYKLVKEVEGWSYFLELYGLLYPEDHKEIINTKCA